MLTLSYICSFIFLGTSLAPNNIQPDSTIKKPIIKFEKLICYKATKNKKGEIKLLNVASNGYLLKGYYTKHSQEKNTYDSSGKFIHSIEYDSTGKILSTSHYLQSPKSQYRNIRVYNSYEKYSDFYHSTVIHDAKFLTDSTFVQTDSSFNLFGELTGVRIMKQKVNSKILHTYELNEKGILKNSSKYIYSGNFLNPITENYDEKDSLKSINYSYTDTINNTYSFVFLKGKDTITTDFEQRNETGLVIHEIHKSFENKTYREYYFEYDDENPLYWAEKLIYDSNKKLIYVIKREINFYED